MMNIVNHGVLNRLLGSAKYHGQVVALSIILNFVIFIGAVLQTSEHRDFVVLSRFVDSGDIALLLILSICSGISFLIANIVGNARMIGPYLATGVLIVATEFLIISKSIFASYPPLNFTGVIFIALAIFFALGSIKALDCGKQLVRRGDKLAEVADYSTKVESIGGTIRGGGKYERLDKKVTKGEVVTSMTVTRDGVIGFGGI